MADEIPSSSVTPNISPSTDDLLSAIQNLALEIRTTRQEHLALAQRVDHGFATILDARPPTTPHNRGILGNTPTGGRRPPLIPPGFPGLDDTHEPGMPKVRFDAPKFNGQDPAGWVYKVQSYFDYFRTPKDLRLRLVGLLFENPACDWFLYQHNNHLITSWRGFLEAVKQRFDPTHYEDYMGLLCKLQQRTSILDYQAEFERLLNKITGVPEATLISVFTAGLKAPIRREVLLRRPYTLGQAFALARELAANHSDMVSTISTSARRPWQSTTAPASTNPPAQTQGSSTVLPASGATTARSAGSSTSLPIRRFNNAAQDERTAKGLCWTCDEKYVPGHKCPNRFMALIGEEEADPSAATELPEDEALPLITGDISSINSLTGCPSPRALKLQGKIQDHPVQILIDGGSTHNFIRPAIVEKLRLSMRSTPPFQVYVGNGASLHAPTIVWPFR
ncbi:unnamed protein product [Cuscuta campestris]|uniref:Ty3 transposon capsid-like protein domain-containing protein n=1 Tax=Cuscuta campestris TaxID=132261 RepID=A0A484N7Z5_9ASTE|nr:unnamed protein product [Cuscuta campestris]